LHIAIRPLGALRLYENDVRELIKVVARDFKVGRAVLTYHDRGNEISRYSTDFMTDRGKPDELRFLRIVIQEPEAYGINRVVNVELNADGTNEVRTQGVQESWVMGKAEAVASFLRQGQKLFATTFRRSGLNIFKALLLAGVLVALPELPPFRRAIFLGLVLAIAWLVDWANARLIPNVLIHLSPRQPGL